jgi:hypothetical protein
MSYRQHPPFCIQIELVEGCNLYCNFCGLQGIREKAGGPYKFMDPLTLTTLMEGIKCAGWTPRIEFAMHGEPTMHPNFVEMLSLTRIALPKAYILLTTNGGGLLKKPGAGHWLKEIFDTGINTVALDCYKYVNVSQKVRESVAAWPGLPTPHEYPAEKEWSPHTRRPGQSLIYVEDISVAAKGTHSRLTNHCGSAFQQNYSMIGKKCAKPFRELSIRWDGGVSICCEDWRGIFKVGNTNETPVSDLWHGKELDAVRRFLYSGMRSNISVCHGCDQRSYRTGLLPDPAGKETLEPPTVDDQEVVDLACAGRPMTLPVLREWEK